MKNYLFLLLINFCLILVKAVDAQPQLDWIVELEDSVRFHPQSVAVGLHSLVAIGGEVFDQNQDSSDLFFRLMDQSGREIDSRRYRTNSMGATESILDIKTYPGGGYIVTGSSYFNGLERNSRWYIIRLDINGTLIWRREFEEYADNPRAIVVDSDIYVIGAGDQDNDSCQLIVRKLEPGGNTAWRHINWIDNVYYLSIASITLTDPWFLSVSGNTESHCFLLNIDEDGYIQDYQTYRSDIERFWASDLINPNDGNGSLIYIGAFQSVQGFDLNMHAFSTRGEWRTVITDLEGYNVPAAAIPVENGLVVAGSIQFGIGGGEDYFLARLNYDGDILWQTTYELEGNDYCKDVVMLDDGSYLIVGTGHPAKLVKTTPDPLFISKPTPVFTPALFSLSAYPSPFNSTAIVSFQSPFTGDVRASLVDINGRELRKYWIPASAGMRVSNRLTIDGNGLTAGTYWLRFEQNGRAATQRLSLVK